MAALARTLAALGNVNRGEKKKPQPPPRVFPKLLPTNKANLDLGCEK